MLHSSDFGNGVKDRVFLWTEKNHFILFSNNFQGAFSFMNLEDQFQVE